MTPAGTRDAPWILKTPPLSSEFEAFRDEALDPAALVIRVGKTELRYHLRCIDDLHTMLGAHGDWMPLGAADEQKPAGDGTIEAWARAADNPVGGWYGLKRGLRGRFAVYVPPVLETLGLADVEHNPRNNRMRGRRLVTRHRNVGRVLAAPQVAVAAIIDRRRRVPALRHGRGHA